MTNQAASSDKIDTKSYWDDHFDTPSDPNELFFAWYDSVRRESFSVDDKGLSLELGPGNGHFSQLAGVSVAVDFSISALKKVREVHTCHLVVADASHLPFKGGCFKRIYTNDLMHHLKAQGKLDASAVEIKRILFPNGFWCISDRRPSFYNSFCLTINAAGRKFLLWMLKCLRRKIQLSGGGVEPPMERKDYAMVKSGMEIVRSSQWRNWGIFWVFCLLQMTRLFLPQRIHFWASNTFLLLCRFLERLLPDKMTCDVCLVMRKEQT